MLRIEAKENLILKACREEAGEIYIYAAGAMGRCTADRLLFEGIPVAGFLVDPEYWREGDSYRGIPILNIESAGLGDGALVVIAKQWHDEGKVERIRRRARTILMDMTSFFYTEDGPDYGFAEKNIASLERTYEMLADDKSRRHMEAWLNQKASGDFGYLESVWEGSQYYDGGIVDFRRIESFVDCGAYDGDSYRSFLERYRESTGKEYGGVAHLFEPESYEKCVARCGGDPRCRIYPLGAWDKRETLSFSSQGTTSVVSRHGENSIEADTIDHVLGGGESGLYQNGHRGKRAERAYWREGDDREVRAHARHLRLPQG